MEGEYLYINLQVEHDAHELLAVWLGKFASKLQNSFEFSRRKFVEMQLNETIPEGTW